MAQTEHDLLKDEELEALFAGVRAQTIAPSEAMMARIIGDAEAELTARASGAERKARSPGLFATLRAALGGWPAVAGLATATLAGVWLGFAGPETVSNGLAQSLWSSDATDSYTLEDLTPSFSDFSALFEES